MEKIKVLCFHGFNQNKEKFIRKASAVRNTHKAKYEFVSFNAPTQIGMIDDIDNINIQVPSYCWYYYSQEDPPNIEWTKVFNTIESVDQLHGFLKSVEHVKELLQNNTYDYYFGYSQGAAFLSLLIELNIINSSNAKKVVFCNGFYPLKVQQDENEEGEKKIK